MAAQIPIKDNAQANEAAMANVRADKLREVLAGHDGTWVAHPALASIASDIFNKHMPAPNQMHVRREDVTVTAKDLLNANIEGGSVTEEGIRKNLNIGLGYMEGWLRGVGCVPINYLMVRSSFPTSFFPKQKAELTIPTGRRCHSRSLPFPTLAMGQTRRQDHRRHNPHQGLRSPPLARTSRRPGEESIQGKQVPACGETFCRTGYGRGICRFLDYVAL